MNETSPLSQNVTIVNRLGLHARAAGKLVKLTDQFKARIIVEKNTQTAEGNSIMELLMLTASPGDTLTIRSEGPEAKAALDAIVELVQQGFEEDVGKL